MKIGRNWSQQRNENCESLLQICPPILFDSAPLVFIVYGKLIGASSYFEDFTAHSGARFLFNDVSRDARRLKDHIKDNV